MHFEIQSALIESKVLNNLQSSIIMKVRNNLTNQQVHHASLSKRMLQGAGVPLILISLFLLSADEARTGMAKALDDQTVRHCAISGWTVLLLNGPVSLPRRAKKLLANIASLLVYTIGLWLGTVLGLDGTLWN